MKPYNRLLYILALIKLVLPYFLQNGVYGPHRDEFLYLAEGQHMAWGFMEIPPVLSVFAWLTQMFGNSMFWIKFWPSLFGALTYILTGKLIIHLGGRYNALFMAFLTFIFSGYLRVHFLFQPNFLEVFFWTMIAYSLIRHIQTEKNYWLYITGLSAGLGMMSKYSVLFFITGVLVGLLLTPQRRLLANRHFYIAAAIGFIIFLPNVIWQYNRNFAVMHHMQELQQTQLQYVNPVNFIIDQFLMFLPVVFIWPVGLWFAAFTKQGKPYRFIAWAWLFVMGILLILKGKSYYSLGVYPVLTAFGAYWLEQVTPKRLRILRYVRAVIPFLFIPIFIPVALPVFAPPQLADFYKKTHAEKTGALRWEDQENHPLPQDFSDMLGWEEMAQKTAAAWHALTPAEQQQTIIFCDNYGQAGAVAFYGKKYGIPQPYSGNASFLYWMPAHIKVVNLLLVTDDSTDMQKPFVKEFASATLCGSITTPYAREHGSQVIMLKGANEKFNQFFKDKIDGKRAYFIKK
jgi:hypothetical protein